MSEVRIRLLGGFEVRVGRTAVPDHAWTRRQAASLVKVLALEPRARLHREQLIDRIWPELLPDDAAPRLHKAAHYARRALGPGSIVLAGDTVALFPERRAVVDVHEFASLAARAVAQSDPDLAAHAADRYGGELLPHDLYAEWAEGERDRLRQLYLDVLRTAGRWEALAAADPTDEEAHLTLARRFAAAGDRGGALRQLERLERTLHQEFGLGLSWAAKGLREQVLSMAPPPGTAPIAPSASAGVGPDAELTRTRRLPR